MRTLQKIQLNDEAKTAFAASIACTAAGGMGALYNHFFDGQSTLHGLMVVGGFYLLIGITSALNRRQAVPQSIAVPKPAARVETDQATAA